MDFNKLYRQIQAIDEGRDCEVEECGMAMTPMNIDKSQSQQPDNVSMNVNMNASGSGGIKDLIDILKNIEQADEPDNGIKLFGRKGDDLDSQTIMIGDEYDNEPNPIEFPVSAMTNPPSDDLHSQGGPEPRMAAGGGNPYQQYTESLVNRLSSLYTEVKNQ